jgi:hypothetical protein
MGRNLENLSFEEWVKYVFDHPVTDPKWYWGDNQDYWYEGEDPALTVSYLIRLFENPLPYLQSYSDGQLNQGMYYIVSGHCADYMGTMADSGLPWETQQRCIMAMKSLFEKLFATRCSPHLCDLSEEGISPINAVCYMWWDIIPVAGFVRDRPELDYAFFEVMEFQLTLDSDACRESALHGLNHYRCCDDSYDGRVQNIIDTFLATTPNLRPELVRYAEGAKTSMWQ